jgi:glycosyltransferase involved in cell wall biosynthesis
MHSVVFLNPVGTLGGAERCLIDLLAMLRAARPRWLLHLIVGAAGPLYDKAVELGVAVQITPMPTAVAEFGESGLALIEMGKPARNVGLAIRSVNAAIRVPKYLRKLRRAIARANPQLVHSNGLKCHLLAGHAVKPGVPVVWHVHDFLTTRPLLGRWLRWLAKPPAIAIANSQAVAADTRAALPGTRVEAVYNGIDLDRFTPGGAGEADLDRLAGIPSAKSGAVHVGLVATYARWKGQDVLIDAAAKLVKRSDLGELRFCIVGGPAYSTAGSQYTAKELRERIAARGLERCFGLAPFQTDLPPIYRALDIVVHASTKPEPFGLTIAEAMACGRAVIAANAGGAAELFTDGHDALGVPPGDSDALAAAIARLVADPALRTRLGNNARATAAARFARQRMAERILAIYESILGNAVRAPH